MELTELEAIAVLGDKDSVVTVVSQIYARLQEFKDERDRLIVQNLALRLEVHGLKHDVIHEVITDNYKLEYRDVKGINNILAKSVIEQKNYKIIVMKG